jgi:hypothetical protein
MQAPIVLATWEAEIRRKMVQSQPRQIAHETLSGKYPTQSRVDGVAQMIDACLASVRPGVQTPVPQKCILYLFIYKCTLMYICVCISM